MATDDSTNTSPSPQLAAAELQSLCGRLVIHADGIQNIAAKGMAQDIRLAAQAITDLLAVNIIISIRGGLVDDVRGIPRGSSIVIRDYDVDGTLETDRDDQGRPCLITRWPQDGEG